MRKFLLLALSLCAAAATYADTAPPGLSAKETAAKLAAAQEGSAFVRLMMQINGPTKSTLQVQIKERREPGGTGNVLYQVLWPKERKGEAVLLRQSGGGLVTGIESSPDGKTRHVTGSDPLLGSDLACQDVIEDFFAWPDQAIVGAEEIGHTHCVILESKPGGSGGTIYTHVRSWIDPTRMVPMRVVKYSGSRPARVIETTRISNDENGHTIPANLTVTEPGHPGETLLDGSRIKTNITYTDQDFTPATLQQLTPPH